MLKMRTIELWRNGGRVVGGDFRCQQIAMQYTNNIRYFIAFVVRRVLALKVSTLIYDF